MSHHQQERENTMKKRLIITFAICVLFLSACGSLVGTSTPASNAVAHPMVPIATASTQSVCQVLHDRQAQLSQAYRAANVQLTAAQAQGNRQQVGETEKMLMRLHQSIAQVQAQLKAC
jgi:protein involved in sex pheromone biosynthesis